MIDCSPTASQEKVGRERRRRRLFSSSAGQLCRSYLETFT